MNSMHGGTSTSPTVLVARFNRHQTPSTLKDHEERNFGCNDNSNLDLGEPLVCRFSLRTRRNQDNNHHDSHDYDCDNLHRSENNSDNLGHIIKQFCRSNE